MDRKTNKINITPMSDAEMININGGVHPAIIIGGVAVVAVLGLGAYNGYSDTIKRR